MKTMRNPFIFSGLLLLSFLATACDPFLFNNPVDPLAPTFSGVITVASAAEMAPLYSGNGIASLYPPELIATKVNGATEYQFQISTSSSFSFSSISFTSPETTTTTYTPVGWSIQDSGTMYYWRCKAKTEGGWGNWSTTSKTFSLSSLEMGTIVPANAEILSDTTPFFNWADISGAATYGFQISATANFASPLINVTSLSPSEYTCTTTLTSGATYYWRIISYNASGIASSVSSTKTFVVFDEVNIINPVNNYTIPNTAGVTLSWGAVTTATGGYEIQLAANANDFTGVPIQETNNLTWTESRLCGNYWWHVRPVATDGTKGAWSATYKMTRTFGDPGESTGGLLFYDKGFYSEGWRFLECAPSDVTVGTTETFRWDRGTVTVDDPAYIPFSGSNSIAIGTGSINTVNIMNDLLWGAEQCAASVCTEFESGEKDDWFLPSLGELELVYKNLYKNGKGSFLTEGTIVYWTSSDWYYNACYWCFEFNMDGNGTTDNLYHVRAIRAF